MAKLKHRQRADYRSKKGPPPPVPLGTQWAESTAYTTREDSEEEVTDLAPPLASFTAYVTYEIHRPQEGEVTLLTQARKQYARYLFVK